MACPKMSTGYTFMYASVCRFIGEPQPTTYMLNITKLFVYYIGMFVLVFTYEMYNIILLIYI